jgi:hypothetical protein
MREISREEYLKAKAIVEEYEQKEWEEGHRQAAWALEEDDPLHEDWDDTAECEYCGELTGKHSKSCPYKDQNEDY